MLVLVVYDIDMNKGKDDQRRLRKVAKMCERYGTRVQNSVFEMIFANREYTEFKEKMLSVIDSARDSVKYYLLGNSWENHVESAGVHGNDNSGMVLVI